MPAPAPTRTGWAAPRGPQGATRPEGLAAVYRHRDPTTTPLYPLVQHHLEIFLAYATAADPDGDGVPQWVEDDFRAHLCCGILAHGFARIRCDACAAERFVAFSCKGRGVCPPCNARRMAEVAAHPTDHVLPPLPLRQWVFSLPKRIRPFLPHDPRLVGDVLPVLLRAGGQYCPQPDTRRKPRLLEATPALDPARARCRAGSWRLHQADGRAARSGHSLPLTAKPTGNTEPFCCRRSSGCWRE